MKQILERYDELDAGKSALSPGGCIAEEVGGGSHFGTDSDLGSDTDAGMSGKPEFRAHSVMY